MGRARTVVVGAGLSGLACAFDLVRAGEDVLVLEAAARPGGVAGTSEKDGFLFEAGPNTIQASSREFRRLCADLGIADRLIAADGRSTRWLWFRGRLVALPASPLEWLSTPLLSARAKLYLASEPFRRFEAPDDGAREPTFAEFLTERIGPEPTRLFAGAFVRGIYAAEIDELGARSAFPRLWKLACEHGGIVRGFLAQRGRSRVATPGPDVPASALLSFPRGLLELVEALQRSLGLAVRTRREVARVERFSGGWNVVLTSATSVFADRVVVAAPSPVTAAILEPAAAGLVDLAPLRAIRHASVTVVHLGIAGEFRLPRGFGYLVPPGAEADGSASPEVLGTIFTSNLFRGRAPAGATSVSSFYRGADAGRFDDARLVEKASADLALAVGASDRPRARTSLIHRWNDVIPRFSPGHDERMQTLLAAIDARLPGIELAGSHVGGVSVESVIARGRAVARKILRRVAEEEITQ